MGRDSKEEHGTHLLCLCQHDCLKEIIGVLAQIDRGRVEEVLIKVTEQPSSHLKIVESNLPALNLQPNKEDEDESEDERVRLG